MSFRRKLVFAALGLGGLILLWVALTPSEPEYLGHPISYWIKPWEYSRHESPATVNAAYAAMDDRAVAWLSDHLFWHPSRLWSIAAKTLNHFGDFMADEQTGDDLRPQAAMALMRLEPRAKAAVPSLEKAVAVPAVRGRDWTARTTALAALIMIRGDRLEPYLEQIKTAGIVQASCLVRAIGRQGTNAAFAVPLLVDLLTNTRPKASYSSVIAALGGIHSQPDLSVPALASFLDQPAFRVEAILALSQFGLDARPALTNITACLNDTNVYTRVLATNTLKAIDAEAARKLGIN